MTETYHMPVWVYGACPYCRGVAHNDNRCPIMEMAAAHPGDSKYETMLELGMV